MWIARAEYADETEIDLCELTHQESGIVWYQDDTVYVGNWRDVTIAADLVRSKRYDRFDDQADINGAREVIDDNGDLRDWTAVADDGMMYELSDETVIFAPHSWN